MLSQLSGPLVRFQLPSFPKGPQPSVVLVVPMAALFKQKKVVETPMAPLRWRAGWWVWG